MTDYIASYTHGDRIGVLVHFRCKDSFAIRTPEFKGMAKDVAMHIAAMRPVTVSPSEVTASQWEAEVMRLRPSLSGLGQGDRQVALRNAREDYEKSFCLLSQPFCKDSSKTVGQLLEENSKLLGDAIRVVRFVRYEESEA